MKIMVYSTKSFDKKHLDNANQGQHALDFTSEALTLETVEKAKGYDGICCFVSDHVNERLMTRLGEQGIKLIALRSTGYDHIDLSAAKKHNITVVRVPKYAPQTVAEFAVGLILALGRHIHKAYQQGFQSNFTLEGLMGFSLYEKTVGIIGTGNIGTAFARIMSGFGCYVLAYDPVPNEECKQLGVRYVELNELYANADIISLHCPHNDQTRNIINAEAFSRMKKGSMLINTARGALVDSQALIQAIELGTLGYAGLDVYAKEAGLFFMDHHGETLQDQQFLKLQSFPNVLITPHCAFLTAEAIINIARTTIDNITAFEKGSPINQV